MLVCSKLQVLDPIALHMLFITLAFGKHVELVWEVREIPGSLNISNSIQFILNRVRYRK